MDYLHGHLAEAYFRQQQAQAGRRPDRPASPSRASGQGPTEPITEATAAKLATDLDAEAREVAKAAVKAGVGARTVRTKRWLRPTDVSSYQPDTFHIGGNVRYGLYEAAIHVTEGFALKAWDRVYDRRHDITLAEFLRREPHAGTLLRRLIADWSADRNLR